MTRGGIIDAHAHVFRPAAISPRGVDELAPADRDAPVEDLLELMAGSGVDAAVLVPLDAHDDYVARVLADHPNTFAAIAVAAPAELRAGGARGVESLRARRDRFGFHGPAHPVVGRARAAGDGLSRVAGPALPRRAESAAVDLPAP